MQATDYIGRGKKDVSRRQGFPIRPVGEQNPPRRPPGQACLVRNPSRLETWTETKRHTRSDSEESERYVCAQIFQISGPSHDVRFMALSRRSLGPATPFSTAGGVNGMPCVHTQRWVPRRPIRARPPPVNERTFASESATVVQKTWFLWGTSRLCTARFASASHYTYSGRAVKIGGRRGGWEEVTQVYTRRQPLALRRAQLTAPCEARKGSTGGQRTNGGPPSRTLRVHPSLLEQRPESIVLVLQPGLARLDR